MKPGTTRSLIVSVFLFGVAALALDVSYAQGRGSGGGQQKQQMPQGQQGQGQMHKDTHQKSHMTQQHKHVREHMPDHGMYGHEMNDDGRGTGTLPAAIK
jgi:pentapeptide MXKDX repeat protein